jgi:pimeloyl-ACP methyl ester carboxylesterase
MKIETRGASLNVQVGGDGDTALVFLHYWGGSSRTWHHVIDRLRWRFQTVAIDQRGWGDSSAIDDDYTIEALARDAQEVIDALALRRYVVVGHSMGGKAAQLLASRRPPGLAGLVLVAPAAPGPSRLPQAQRAMMVHAYDSADSVAATCRHVLTAKPLDDDDRACVVEDSLRGTAAAKRAWPLEAMMEDIRPAMAHVEVPVLVVAGDCDKVDPLEGLKEDVLPLIPQARLEVIPATGHLSPLESPSELAGHIAAFAGEL